MTLDELLYLFNNKIELTQKDNFIGKIIKELAYINCNINCDFIDETNRKFPHQYFYNNTEPKISACILTLNESRTIDRCINSIKEDVDEIIVVDSGSTDNTLKIINERFTNAIVIKEQWNDDFSLLRNKAIEYTTNDWIFFIDADEYIDDQSKGKIKKIVNFLQPLDCQPYYISPYIKDHNGDQYTNTKRIFNKKYKLYYRGKVHEELFHDNYEFITDIGINVIMHHDGYKKEVMKNKDKILRNLNLIELMLKEEPLNIKWKFYFAKNLLNQSSASSKIKAEKILTTIIDSSRVEDPYFLKSFILLCQVYISKSDLSKLKESIHYMKSNKIPVPQLDLAYLEMVFTLMAYQSKLSYMSTAIEPMIAEINNSYISSNNNHIKNIISIIGFFIGDFDKYFKYLPDTDNLFEFNSRILLDKLNDSLRKNHK